MLDDLDLPNQFRKLLKVLRNISQTHPTFKLGETVADLEKISIEEVASLPRIGKLYISNFKELKLLIGAQAATIPETVDSQRANSEIDLTSIDIDNMRFRYACLEAVSVRALEKYARYLGCDDLSNQLNKILMFDREALISLPGFGSLIADNLIGVKEKVKKEMQYILEGRIDYERLQSHLIVPKNLKIISILELDNILLEDIDGFLDVISDSESDLIQKRWGFVESKETLEEIAKGLDITRERVRQIEGKINKYLPKYLRISQHALWQIIEPELSVQIESKLSNLFSCFSDKRDFYNFLGFICGKTNLFECVYQKFDTSFLSALFIENGSPISINNAIDGFTELGCSYIKDIDRAIQYFIRQGVLRVEEGLFWPMALGKSEAIACVLADHERGLPWLDVAKIVNSNHYSKYKIYEDRLDAEAFKLPEYIYLAGKGIYRHTKFIDRESISLDDIFIAIMEYSETEKKSVFHLNQCYQASGVLRHYDYFVVRHFVKQFGEDYGIYFDGKSQTDSIGMERSFITITQKDVIIDSLNRNEAPLTKPEIANVLKSKSRNHASFYIDGLIHDGKVVQVDRMLYTTPELAYRNINIDDYVNAIDRVLHKHEKPVEPSIFKEELNINFSKSYSKYFYSSIARLYAINKGWFRKHSIYSINEIPFNNLNALLDDACNLNLSTDANIALIQKKIAITRESALIAFSNWSGKLGR